MSKTLNNNGNVVNLRTNGPVFFRKPTTDPNELAIARKLKENPHPHIVQIYNIGSNFVDMELVDVYVSKSDCLAQISGLRQAKNHMHKNGIVYLDWKADNMGRGTDGNIKIFDFDSSGLINKNRQWNWKPRTEGYLYRNARNVVGNTDPIKIDDTIFERFEGKK